MEEDINLNFKGQPFIRKYAETKDDVISLRLNPEERRILNALMRACHCGQDGTTIKQAVLYLHNIIHGLPPLDFYLWLSSARRVRDRPD